MAKIDIKKYASTVSWFGEDTQRATVFLDRYSLKDPSGNPTELTPVDMWDRVAKGISNSEEQWSRFFGILNGFKFVPGGRILSGAGTDTQVTYYNCYVIPVETREHRENRERREQHLPTIDTKGYDSREAIIDTIGVMVDIMSRGGGVGVNWSVLRPRGAYLRTINATSSGPVDWMHLASTAVGTVEQGGSRRGAAMFMLDDWHPDVLEFINAKRDETRILNANISVSVSERFMETVKRGEDWVFRFPDTTFDKYNSEWDGDIERWESRGYPVIDYKRMPATDVWQAIAESAHASGEPGVVFLGRYNGLSTAKGVEKIISVNPCGEQGLGAYAVCNLGSMNLAAYLEHNGVTRKTVFNWDQYKKDITVAVEFLDAVIDKNYYFLPENERIQKKLRRIGLGVMGLADVLIALELEYGSESAITFTSRIFSVLRKYAIKASIELAKRYGPAPAFDSEMAFRPYFRGFEDDITEHGIRNLFLLTQAPTGTTSILAGVNSGIEPYFNWSYVRKDRTGEHLVVSAPVLRYMNEKNLTVAFDKELRPSMLPPLPSYFKSAQDVSVEEHVYMQAAAQESIDSSVSKTINAPSDQSVEDTIAAFDLAYATGCKGLAYYRDGSRGVQVLNNIGEEKAKIDDLNKVISDLEEKLLAQQAELIPFAIQTERPKTISGTTTKVHTSSGTAYVTVNKTDDGTPFEVFVNVGKAGSDIMELGEAIGRLASLALRHGASLGGVANQLEGIGGNQKFNPPLASAIGRTLTGLNGTDKASAVEYNPSSGGGISVVGYPIISTGSKPQQPSKKNTGSLCQQCSNFAVVFEEGCEKCHICGWAAC